VEGLKEHFLTSARSGEKRVTLYFKSSEETIGGGQVARLYRKAIRNLKYGKSARGKCKAGASEVLLLTKGHVPTRWQT